MSEDITQRNAQNCKNYRRRKKFENQGAVKITSKKRTNSEHCRMYRQRKKWISQQIQCENDLLDTPSTSLQMIHDSEDTIQSEMKEVTQQSDKQTDDQQDERYSEILNDHIEKRKVSELDKFKRRLIRAIARLLYTENKTEDEIWDHLKTETGCDCELLWSRMRALTIKKLARLFAAEDKIENITKIVQLSVTDWLLYDLVLVHEKVDVIGQELQYEEEPAFLRDIFDLVEEFNIENDIGEALIKKWFDATAKYNNTGKRRCSPMLLQKRWYQLKERSRSNFYNFWFEYRGNSRKLDKANEIKPSNLQLDIVKRYKEIVTKPFLSWEDLIKERRVALPEDFERLRLSRKKDTISENEPDLQIIEAQVETIDLEETNDTNDSVDKHTDNTEGFNNFNIDIVKIESLAEQDDDVRVLESVHIPLEKPVSGEISNSDVDVATTKSSNDNDLEIIESDSEEMLPKIASVTSTAYLESAKDTNINVELPPDDVINLDDSETRAEGVTEVNIILEQIVENVVETNININFDEVTASTSKEKALDLDKEIKDLRSNLIIDLDKEEKRPDINTETLTKTTKKYDINEDIGFDVISNNLNFIDDGIEFVDDGIEYTDEDCIQEYNIQSEVKSETIEVKTEEEPKIDLKLLLTPVVFTKKLDDMDVFRFIDYNAVKDDRVLQNAARESKPKDMKSIGMKEVIQKCKIESSNVKSSDIPDDEVALSSWLFRKPKVNYYNPIQLCKNPDFNTRLKRLTAAFYTSQRNRLQLKQCKPLTVDLHKNFECKLIDNTLYFKKTKKCLDVKVTFNDMTGTSCKTELPETVVDSIKNEIAVDQQISIEKTPENHTERNKVINLPDKDQIRRVNQGLLVAEVSPIQVSNPVNQTNSKPAINVVNTFIEPVIQHMDSISSSKEIIVTPENVPRLSLQMDKIVAVPENDNHKLRESIDADVEQSQALASKYTAIDNAINYKGHNNKSLIKQPVLKPKTKTISNKYMELSWLPKPQSSRTDPIDCLLAADTVERILSLCKNDYVSPNPKVLTSKKKKKSGIADKTITKNQIRAIRQKNTIQEKKNGKETQKTKKSKCRINITTQTTNIKNVCCWSRQKILNPNMAITGRHLCAYNRCVCCCKADLEVVEEKRKRCELIILSDDESITPATIQNPVSKVTVGTNTDYDKDFEDQFAANLNLMKDSAKQVCTPIISLPLGNMKQTVSNETGCQTLTPHRLKKPPNNIIPDDKSSEDTSLHKNKPKIPICLGKNKILLCSFKPTSGAVTIQKIEKNNHSNQSEETLPEGCHFVLLPNRELALSIDPGVELDDNQLSKLPTLIASAQKQINIIPTSENIVKPYNATLNEDTVINLSDNEKCDIKDNLNNILNVNVSSTSNSSPAETHIDSTETNTVTDICAVLDEEKHISNSLSSPKELSDIPEPVTTNNSTITDIKKDVLVKSPTDKITSKDNKSGEVTVNFTNNSEDASGVNKKTILSDLMEMSGISTDDINVTTNDVNVAGDDDIVSDNVSGVTTNESISIIQQVSFQSDNYTSDLQRVYASITGDSEISPIYNNIIIRAALLRCPELNIVSSFPELKYAYENGAQFFKMDVENGIIVPINVCIKNDFEDIRRQRRKGVLKISKSVIDLTEDNEVATGSSNIRPIQPKMLIPEPNELSHYNTSQNTQHDVEKNESSVKPMKMFKAVLPSILRYSGRSLLVRPLKNSTVVQNKIIELKKHRRKQGFSIKNLDLDSNDYLDTQNNKNDSDEESDEEPLAKKAKRLKDNLGKDTMNQYNDQPVDVDDDNKTKKSATMDTNYEFSTRLEPIVFDDNNGQSSDEDCILGV